jgi:hypothetical protein
MTLPYNDALLRSAEPAKVSRHMTEISTNRSVRRQQFRAAARMILQDARGTWGTADHVGQLASAMERAYAAGAANAGRAEEAPDAAGYVGWDAIPRRSQDVLQDITFRVRSRIDEIRAGELVAAIEGAGETSPRGERASFSLWRDDGELMHRIEGSGCREWASSSISALVRLGIFEPLELHDSGVRFVALTPLGLATIETAVAARSLYTFD